jgi:hypothetical protein
MMAAKRASSSPNLGPTPLAEWVRLGGTEGRKDRVRVVERERDEALGNATPRAFTVPS